MIKSCKITFWFARKGQKRIEISELVKKANVEVQNSMNKEIEDDFIPLSKQLAIQEKLKESIRIQLKTQYEGQDPNPHKLVSRPAKGAVWGLGGQLILANKKIHLQGLKDKHADIIEFLELHQVKDIYIHDFHKDNPEKPDTQKKRYHFIGSCFSSRHCWRVGNELKNAFNLNSAKSKLHQNRPYDPIYAIKIGRKDQEWIIVEYKNYCISLMTLQQRQAVELEWKWNNPVPEQVIEKYNRIKIYRKGSKNIFEQF